MGTGQLPPQEAALGTHDDCFLGPATAPRSGAGRPTVLLPPFRGTLRRRHIWLLPLSCDGILCAEEVNRVDLLYISLDDEGPLPVSSGTLGPLVGEVRSPITITG